MALKVCVLCPGVEYREASVLPCDPSCVKRRLHETAQAYQEEILPISAFLLQVFHIWNPVTGQRMCKGI